jgi:hypothetical protein
MAFSSILEIMLQAAGTFQVCQSEKIGDDTVFSERNHLFFHVAQLKVETYNDVLTGGPIFPVGGDTNRGIGKNERRKRSLLRIYPSEGRRGRPFLCSLFT